LNLELRICLGFRVWELELFLILHPLRITGELVFANVVCYHRFKMVLEELR
jgi:hypothetical protein